MMLVLLLLAAMAASAVAAPNDAWQDGKTRRVWIGEARQEEGQVVVPVEIDDLSKVVAVDLDLVFDSSALTVETVRRTDLLSGFLVISNVVADTLRIAIAGAQAAAGSGAFVEVVVEAGDAPVVFAIGEVLLNGNLIPVEYERFEKEEPQDPTAVQAVDKLPPGYGLAQNFPNPFNAATTMEYSLAATCRVELVVFNAAGQRVRRLVEGERPAGVHRVKWDGKDEKGRAVASGRYVARLVAGEFRKEIGMALVR